MKWHKPLLRRLLCSLNSAGVRRTGMEGQRLVTKFLGSQIPTEIPISDTLKGQTLLFRKELKLPGQAGARAEAGPKKYQLATKMCPCPASP